MRRSKKRGFSLGEILVAVAIIAVLAAVVLPSIGSQLKTGDEGRMESDLTNIRSAAEQFLADVRRYPISVGQLIVRPAGTATTDTSLVGGAYSASQKARWRGPYLAKDSLSAVITGFDVSITSAFSNTAISGQNYLTIQIPSLDTASALRIDRRMDDGVATTGMIQWSTAAATTTLKYFALPIQ